MDKNHPDLVHQATRQSWFVSGTAGSHSSVTKQGRKAMKTFLIRNKFKVHFSLEGEGNCTPSCSIPDLLPLATRLRAAHRFCSVLAGCPNPAPNLCGQTHGCSAGAVFLGQNSSFPQVAAVQAAGERAGLELTHVPETSFPNF